MRILLHRISHHAEVAHPLLLNNVLTIGFSDFATDEFLNSVLSGTNWEDRWAALEDAFDNEWGSRPKTRHNLWRFVEGLKKGDWIVVPNWWGTFGVFEIVGESVKPIGELNTEGLVDWQKRSIYVKNGLLCRMEMPDKEANIDLGFFWEVKPIMKGIPRGEYADAVLTAKMKIRTTNAWITETKPSIENAIAAYAEKKPINLHSQIIDATKDLILSKLKSELNPSKFELLVKWYFERVGASDAFIPAKNEANKEGDADVIAIFEPIKTIIYAQVKFHSGETSSWAIEQIKNYRNYKDAMDDGYLRLSWVVSTADKYTEECFAIAKDEKVLLINGEKFATMLIEAGITNLEKAL